MATWWTAFPCSRCSPSIFPLSERNRGTRRGNTVREVWGGGEEGGRGVMAVTLSGERVSPSSAVTLTRALPLLLAAVSSLRLIRGKWQGAVALAGDLEGVMMGASGQGPQEGCLLVVIPRYLCRGHRGHPHPRARTLSLSLTLADSCSSLDSLFALGRKMGTGKQTAGSVCPDAHRTPSISELPLPPSALSEERQSFLPLLPSPSLSFPLPQFFPPSPRVYWSSLGSVQI